ncbi:MAG: chemotaxis response regulator protein-glutamate methylesterase [Candidatus Riflebacteria bacterium]|nr:chemotaxis response regulator protein-glutamate methylesterase [Candidatus Riflebacteria bacterium]
MESSKIIKLLIVDDSAFMRAALERMLKDEPDISVIGSATNGKEAIEKVSRLRPDVVTLDVEMPVMDGLQTLKEIMRLFPVPVIMVSAATQSGATSTIQALEFGAIDFVGKPGYGVSVNILSLKNELLTKIRAASCSCPNATKKLLKSDEISAKGSSQVSSPDKLIMIGASTGGPPAVEKILSSFPTLFMSSIVVAQHMPPVFTNALAQRLNSTCRIRVREAVDGEIIQKSIAYICPGGLQTRIIKHPDGRPAFRISHEGSEKFKFAPNIDNLFESGLEVFHLKCIAVILTGMGEDGVSGLAKIRDSGCFTIAQDKQTSVVYGMPKAAAERNAACRILPVSEIARELIIALNA